LTFYITTILSYTSRKIFMVFTCLQTTCFSNGKGQFVSRPFKGMLKILNLKRSMGYEINFIDNKFLNIV